MHSLTRYTACKSDLIVQELGDELLIYDERTDVAHCLTDVAAIVWRACEDGATLDELLPRLADRDGSEDPESLALSALAELQEKDLVESLGAAAPGITRKQALRRMAMVGAAAAAVPLVVSAAAPTPAAAASPCKGVSQGPCTMTSECCTGTSPALVCNTSTSICVGCAASGSKPGGENCSSTNNYLCCAGHGCSTKFCAA